MSTGARCSRLVPSARALPATRAIFGVRSAASHTPAQQRVGVMVERLLAARIRQSRVRICWARSRCRQTRCNSDEAVLELSARCRSRVPAAAPRCRMSRRNTTRGVEAMRLTPVPGLSSGYGSSDLTTREQTSHRPLSSSSIGSTWRLRFREKDSVVGGLGPMPLAAASATTLDPLGRRWMGPDVVLRARQRRIAKHHLVPRAMPALTATSSHRLKDYARPCPRQPTAAPSRAQSRSR